jgi:uncharacterized protein (TIGR02186 family)
MTRRGLLLTLALACCAATYARAEELVMSLGADVISIRSNFTGAAVSVIGVIERDAATASRAGNYDAVVTVRGPRGAVSVWRKRPVGPLWLNLDQRKFIAIPSFISVLSNRNLDAIVSPEMRARNFIGVNALLPEQLPARGADAPEFLAALQRLRTSDGLFMSNETAVRFVTPSVFQARIVIPGRAPLGKYDVDLALFADGALLARKEQSFNVTKAGVEQSFSMAARNYSLYYGLTSVLIALLFGWFASTIFRRD